ncbi:MAG: elongation factor G [Phycisphaerae bacterium]
MARTATVEEEDGTADTSGLAKVRNIGIAAHIDAGKTTTTERILYYTGRTHRMGDVDDGTTATDFDSQEQNRGITIFSAAVTCPWRDHTLNLIDTPGHVDFTAEVERCLRVLDGAVVVFDAKEGVEAQSETVWRQARRYRVPCICFVNKMDKIGADFFMSVASMEKRLDAGPVPVQIPIGAEDHFEGVIDLLEMQAVRFIAEGGTRLDVGDIPADLLDTARQWRHHLEEKVAEHDDALMEKYLEEQSLTSIEIRPVLRRETIAGRLQPVFCGSSLKHMGVQTLLDGVVDYLPSPLDRPPVTGTRSMDDLTEIERRPDAAAPLSALIFKLVAEKPLDLYYIRVYSGVLKGNSRVFNINTGKKENLSRLFRMFAKRREQIDRAGPGEIVAGVGLKAALTGHTLCDANQPIVLERIEFPTPVLRVSVEPRNSKDKDALVDALGKLERQDPTFQHTINEETGQTLLSGMGELHLEVLAHRLAQDFGVPVNVGQPIVAYRETVTQAAEGEGRFIRQTATSSQFAVVRLKIEPFVPKRGHEPFDFTDASDEGLLRREYIEAVKDGVRDCGQVGPLAGYPLIHARVTLLGGEQHESDSSELAFETAARFAFDDAVKRAQPVMLEPVMRLEVLAPEDYFGIISGDLSARRGIIQDTEVRGSQRVIHAHVPLAQMFQYATHIRTLTQGRAGYSMEPHAYEPMPPALEKDLLRSYGYID